MIPVYKGPWNRGYFCKRCYGMIRSTDELWAGMCPMCGLESTMWTGLLQHDTVPIRLVLTVKPKWWQFWKKKAGYYETQNPLPNQQQKFPLTRPNPAKTNKETHDPQ